MRRPITVFYFSILFLAMLLCLLACQPDQAAAPPSTISSPDGKVLLQVFTTPEGEAAYRVQYKEQVILDTSRLGFNFANEEELRSGLQIVAIDSSDYSETWQMPWGEQRTVRNEYRQLSASFVESDPPQRSMNVLFRVYDDGLGFRYELPGTTGDTALITEEQTEFTLTGDHTCWWIPGDWDIYEHLYNTTPVSGINAIAKRNHPNLAQTTIPNNAVNTPVTMRTSDGLHLSLHEAALYDYSGMTIGVDTNTLQMRSILVGGPGNIKVRRAYPFTTPWRTLQIGERAGDLIDSKLIVNLNEPSQLDDISWFESMKYMGIWWEMHLGKSTWNKESGRHGATTENAKRYIDFAAANDIRGLLVEGWNTGWERWIGFPDREGVFDFVTPYADYDIREVVDYARDKGVQIVMHHETSAAPRTYEEQLDTAYALCQELGIHAVKTGYVGPIIPEGQYHHGQWMVRHYQQVVETAAEHKVVVNAHEPIKATGKRRTWPNIISREGLRGQEFNAWSVDMNPPEHTLIVPFTRMLSGPIDFTPGIFNIKFDEWKEDNQVNTTLAKQLALYILLYSPIQMAADLPEHYEGEPAFQFIRDVAVDWDTSLVLNGEVGDYLTMARKAKNTEQWFLGAATDEEARSLKANLDFLDPQRVYRAEIYQDAADAHWEDNPLAIRIRTEEVRRGDTLAIELAPGGGMAVRLVPVGRIDVKGSEKNTSSQR